MFLENASRKGWIEVVCGSMFSGKTEELIRRLKRAKFAHQRVEIFKPRIDVRYSEEEVVSHDANAIRSTPVESPQNILLMTVDVDVVGIDEAQFFDESIVDVCRQLADNGVRVIVAGLDMDYTGRPFGPMPALMATAEYVTKVHAICVRCGNLAHHSHRLTSDEKQVMLGRAGQLRTDLPPLLQQADERRESVGPRPQGGGYDKKPQSGNTGCGSVLRDRGFALRHAGALRGRRAGRR